MFLKKWSALKIVAKPMLISFEALTLSFYITNELHDHNTDVEFSTPTYRARYFISDVDKQ